MAEPEIPGPGQVPAARRAAGVVSSGPTTRNASDGAGPEQRQSAPLGWGAEAPAAE